MNEFIVSTIIYDTIARLIGLYLNELQDKYEYH